MYRLVDAAMVRVATCTSADDVLPWPDLTCDTGERVAGWCDWLERAWAQNEFAAAVELASPVLAHRVREVCAGRVRHEPSVRQVVVSVVRYLLRSTGRATPFGLFAGVAPARFGEDLVAGFGDGNRAVARVDAVWLADVITQLEACPELLQRLPVVRNNLAFIRDGRVVLRWRPQAGPPSSNVPAEVSIRHTKPVDTVLCAARSPVPAGELTAKLTSRFPGTPEQVIAQMLAELVTQRILLTSLRPHGTTTDPLAHLIGELIAAGADTIPQTESLVSRLRQVHATLVQHHDASSPAAARAARLAAVQKMTSLAAVERPLAVDLRVDLDLVLPPTVAREAEHMAGVLARLTSYPSGVPVWRDYHAAFLERYGTGAVVPLVQLLDADVGLGLPAGYRDSLREPPVRSISERDRRLLALAQDAAIDRSIEVVLDDRMIADLTAEDFNPARVQPHTELNVSIHAPSRDALRRGEFTLALVGASRAAGTIAGRFLDLFDRPDRDRITAEYGRLPTMAEGARPAQVSCPPLYQRTNNIARSLRMLSQVIPLAEHRHSGDGLISVDDLAVGGDYQRLYLWSVSQRQPVEPLVFSAVELANAAHPYLRFLSEISTARVAPCGPFSWGAADQLPFLPRLRYRRAILSPARWRLPAADLPGPGTSWSQWKQRLTDWRRRWFVSGTILLGDDDRRIRLNLNEPTHLYLLRSELDRTGHATVREAPGTTAFGWLDGHAHEIVLPLAATRKSPSPVARTNRPVRSTGSEHGHLPGASEWLFVKLYGHPGRHTAILTVHFPELLALWDEPPQWWFLPYQDPEKHLRLRFRLPNPDMFGETARRVSTWAAQIRRLGLIGRVQLDTYYPETGRFGAGAALAAAEAVFAADSAAAIAQREHSVQNDAAHQHAVTAASLVNLVVSFVGSTEDGMPWLIEHITKNPIPAPVREVYSQAIRLAYPEDRQVRALPGGERMEAAWERRRLVVAAYRGALAGDDQTDPNSVLLSLLHLHCVRAAGINPDTERSCHHLARAAALSWTTRCRAAP